MDGIHPPFEGKGLDITLKTNDSDSDADTVISDLERTIEDLVTTFDTEKIVAEDSETEPTMTAEATFAWLADEVKRKLELLDDKNKELNELHRVHDKIREEDRVRKEFVDVISDKIKEIATPKSLHLKKG